MSGEIRAMTTTCVVKFDEQQRTCQAATGEQKWYEADDLYTGQRSLQAVRSSNP